jgi:Na+/phosphate symporter
MEHSEIHINTFKVETLEDIIKKFMEKILGMVNQNVQDALKKFHNTKNEEHEKTQKQIKELRGLKQQQSETKDTIKREYIN